MPTKPAKPDSLSAAEARTTFDLQVRICKRAEKEIKGWDRDRLSFTMDLQSVPDLDLLALLEAPKFDFAHDVIGIVSHMDRSSYPGKLTDSFLPRSCRPTSQD